MDAPEDRDIKLQKIAGDLIEDVKTALPNVLWKDEEKKKLHNDVSEPDLRRISGRLEPFQEAPQLLDPHLTYYLRHLTEAFKVYLTTSRPKQRPSIDPVPVAEVPAVDILPAIGKLLYLFIKIRGVKVVRRFLPNEAKWIEPLLKIFRGDVPEEGEKVTFNSVYSGEDLIPAAPGSIGVDGCNRGMAWELRYVALIWLSYLLLSPFPLDTILKLDSGRWFPVGVELPPLPPGARRLVCLSSYYLGSPGKDRDAAADVLVRLLVRRDTREKLLSWFLDSASHVVAKQLEPETLTKDDFALSGALSVLIKTFSSSDSTALSSQFVDKVCEKIVHRLTTEKSSPVTRNSLIRKLVCKLQRNIAIHLLPTNISLEDIPSQVDEIVDSLMNLLGDHDTLVRYAASKALSAVSQRLPIKAREQVLSAVVDLYENDVFYPNRHKNSAQTVKDTSQVSASLWHGVTLTLATFLRHKSASPEMLPKITDWIVTTLSFEQRKSTFALGSNVRDAACYACWSLSRNYSTKTLLSVKLPNSTSIPQFLSQELVKVACLDSIGNIRRAASAALQELIGRHPYVIDGGIDIVQTVDYMAVALRSRANADVTFRASQLGGWKNWDTLADGMIHGWRGIAVQDPDGRRSSAKGFGALVESAIAREGNDRAAAAISKLLERLKVDGEDAELRHGGWLAAAEALKKLDQPNLFINIFDGTKSRYFVQSILRPELSCEAASNLINVLCRSSLDLTMSLKRTYLAIVDASLTRIEPVVLESSSAASYALLSRLSSENLQDVIKFWLHKLRLSGKERVGFVKALGTVFGLVDGPMQERMLDSFVKSSKDRTVEVRVMAISAITDGVVPLQLVGNRTMQVFSNALDDYSVDSRGDVGSWVRLEAINAILVSHRHRVEDQEDILKKLVRLSVERLDKVRLRASEALFEMLPSFPGRGGDVFDGISRTSVFWTNADVYFSIIIKLFEDPTLRVDFLKGYVTCIAGSESVVRASTKAFIKYLDGLEPYSNQNVSLNDVMNTLIVVLEEANESSEDRILAPALEMLAGWFESGIVSRLEGGNFEFPKLFSLVQKSHFQKGHMGKLSSAVKVYAGLASIEVVKKPTSRKLVSLLVHPFPKIRAEVADVLYLSLSTEGMNEDAELLIMDTNWVNDPKELKSTVEQIKEALKL